VEGGIFTKQAGSCGWAQKGLANKELTGHGLLARGKEGREVDPSECGRGSSSTRPPLHNRGGVGVLLGAPSYNGLVSGEVSYLAS
jgi:hypothetical protein